MTKFDNNVVAFFFLLAFVGALSRYTHEPANRSFPNVASIYSSSEEASPLTVLSTPRVVPELHVVDGNGAAVTLADFRGKVVLLNVWATWCTPCKAEIRHLAKLQATLGGDAFEVVALSVDQGGAAHVQSFYEQLGIGQLGLYVDRAGYIVRDLNIIGIPTALLIGRDGREVGRAVGPIDWDSEEAMSTIDRVLNSTR